MDDSRASQFSLCGNFFAHTNCNGVLKIWDTTTGALHQEYTPASHLAALGSCLQWAPFKIRPGGGRKKKKKEGANSGATETLSLVAWGTEPGHIFLYSFTKGELQNKLENGHSAKINDLCWNNEGSTLFSCSDDCKIAEWDVASASLRSSWKADKKAVSSLSLSADGNFLISASRKIKFWDSKTHSLLQTFTGHATPVDRLLFIHPPSVENFGPLASRPYFISAASDDRVINIWQYNPDVTSSRTTSALVSMTIPEEAQHISLKQPDSIGEPILLSVVTKAGLLYVFQHRLNGPMQKPLNPKVTINVINSSSDDCSSNLAVLSSLMRVDKAILFSFGSFLTPRFEKVSYNPCQPLLTLERSLPSSSPPVKADVSKVQKMVIEKVKVLGPGDHVVSQAEEAALLARPKNRKRKLSAKKETTPTSCLPSFAELLAKPKSSSSSVAFASPATSGSQLGVIPKSKEKTILLTQGLVSQDSTIINNVLNETNDILIKNTVKGLAIDYIQPLMDCLFTRLKGHPKVALNAARWVRCILKFHTGYLLSNGNLLQKMEGIYQMMEARATMYERATRLQGRLDLVITQVELRKEQQTASAGAGDAAPSTQRALYTFEQDDDDEENELMKSLKDSDSEADDASMGEWINISAPGSPTRSEDHEGGSLEGWDGSMECASGPGSPMTQEKKDDEELREKVGKLFGDEDLQDSGAESDDSS